MFPRMHCGIAEIRPIASAAHRILAVGGVSALVVAAGCGAGGNAANTAHLQGTVTVDGKPLPTDVEASITFKPTASGQGHTAGAQILGGKFDVANVPKGSDKVYISIQQPTGKMIREGSGSPFAEYKNIIAQEYGSGITLEVAGDNSKQDFDLKSP